MTILLLLVFSSTLSAPLLAAIFHSPQDDLPACCRRNGKHHCMMAMMPAEMLKDGSAWFALPVSHCPFFPHSQSASTQQQVHQLGLAPAAQFFAAVFSHPALQAQTEAMRRIAFDRSRQKRGPPDTTIL